MRRSIILVGVLVFVVIVSARLYSGALETVEEEQQTPQALNTVKIGLFSCVDGDYEEYTYLGEEASRDINTYCNETGNGYRFEFLIGNAGGSSSKAESLVAEFHGEGADVIIGYDFNSFYCKSYVYCKENNLTIISPSSTSPLNAVPDSFYRLSPTDTHQAIPITRVIQSLGATDVVILQHCDYWGDEIVHAFKEAYEAEGGRVHETVSYPIEATEFTDYLEAVDAVVQTSITENGANSTVVLLVSFNEAAWILRDAAAFPSLLDSPWVGTDGTFGSQYIVEEAGFEASRVTLVSLRPAPSPTPAYLRLNASYTPLFNRSLGLKYANVYDGCWVAALSVMEAESSGRTIAETLPGVAAGYTGATGLCRLDEYGDRETVDYELWGYYTVDGECVMLRCGTYRHDTDDVEWIELEADTT
ncbi:ABC transporter substrate-binding protein [Candidatus Bathyarchaeota archaeon]|nr:ABC transporter substrate-binding protein [Candidatus Bathyarchaeota archaeon]